MSSLFELPTPIDSGVTPNGTAWSKFGSGPVVVLIHGVGMQQAYWAPQVHDLMQDFTVITYDQWGHGKSAVNESATTIDDFSDQLLALLDSLNVTSANIVGHSLGALNTMNFLRKHEDRCDSAVLLNIVYDRTDVQREQVRKRAEELKTTGAMNINPTLERWFGSPDATEFPEAEQLCRHLLESVNGAGYANAYMLFASDSDIPAAELAKVQTRLVFATGDGDPNSTPAMSHAMAHIAPNGECIVLEGHRHMMSLTAIDAVSDIIRKTVNNEEITGGES
jgi:pimeloyl-ACP methyl ester carboxylesterase